MPHLDVAGRFLRDHRRSLVGWSIGLMIYLAMIAALWPVLSESDSFQDVYDDLPEAFDAMFGGAGGIDLSTPTGYLDTYVFSLIAPLVAIIAAVIAGSSAIGGEEEEGTLELLLSHPIGRTRVALEKSLAIGVYTLVLAVVVAVTLLIAAPLVDLDVSESNTIIASVGLWLASAVAGLLALFAGAVTGSRSTGAAVAGAVIGLSYLLQVVAQLADDWDWVQWISVLYLANGTSPITNGWPTTEYLVLTGAVVVLVAATVVALRRRDLRA